MTPGKNGHYVVTFYHDSLTAVPGECSAAGLLLA
jgi:hypothetical protein